MTEPTRPAMRPLAIVTLLAAGFGLGGLLAGGSLGRLDAEAAFGSRRLETARELSAAYTEVAATIAPSVVNISSRRKVEASEPLRRIPDQLRDFFGPDFFDHFFSPPGPGGGLLQGLGAGVIVSEDGYIVTNEHVVREADEVTVKLSDEREFTASVVGTDSKTDLAVLKIEAEGLNPARIGDSDALEIGELVVASGSPFGLTATVTAGIVSAKGRAHVGISDYEDFIQTDAAINPGNSGGPLVNLEGEVVGINTAIFTRTGGYMGIGFAIPSNMVKSVMRSLIDEGHVVRGWLGVAIQPLNDKLAKSFGYDSSDGVLVGDVTEDSPAANAGIEAGDIILSYDGRDVDEIGKLRSVVAATRPGARVPVKIFRDGETRRVEVEIGELEGEAADEREYGVTSPNLGMSLRTLTPELARERGVEEESGALVVGVDALGAASKAGIRINDVIIRVGDVPVTSVDDLRRAVDAERTADGVRLTVVTRGVRRFVYVETK